MQKMLWLFVVKANRIRQSLFASRRFRVMQMSNKDLCWNTICQDKLDPVIKEILIKGIAASLFEKPIIVRILSL